jgi:hypothetical protein
MTRVTSEGAAFNATLKAQQSADTAVADGGVTRRGATTSISGVANSGTTVTRAEARQTVSAFEGHLSFDRMRDAVRNNPNLNATSKANVLAEIARREAAAHRP